MSSAAGTALRVAHIDTTHGLRGEVSAAILTDFPERFAALEKVRVGRTADAPPRRLLAWRLHRSKVILKLEGVQDVEAARALVGSDVWIDAREAVPLPENTYFQHDLIGLEVRARSGQVLGRVEDVLRTGGTDVLVVRDSTGEILIPAAKEICVEVDLEAGCIVVEPPEGLLEINAV